MRAQHVAQCRWEEEEELVLQVPRGFIKKKISPSFHIPSAHPFCKMWFLANASQCFECLLLDAGFWALILPWRHWGNLTDCSCWQRVEKGLVLDCQSNKWSSWTDLCLLWTPPVFFLSSPFYVWIYLLLLVCELDYLSQVKLNSVMNHLKTRQDFVFGKTDVLGFTKLWTSGCILTV